MSIGHLVIWSSGHLVTWSSGHMVIWSFPIFWQTVLFLWNTRIICAHSESCFGDLIKQSGYLVFCEIFLTWILNDFSGFLGIPKLEEWRFFGQKRCLCLNNRFSENILTRHCQRIFSEGKSSYIWDNWKAKLSFSHKISSKKKFWKPKKL